MEPALRLSRMYTIPTDSGRHHLNFAENRTVTVLERIQVYTQGHTYMAWTVNGRQR